MEEETSLENEQNENNELEIINYKKPLENFDDFFSLVFDDNLNLRVNEEEFKNVLSLNYHQVILTSDERNKFLEEFDQIKDKLSHAHQKILNLFQKKDQDNNEIQDDVSSESKSSVDLDEKIDDFIEKKKENKKENVGFSDAGPQKDMEEQVNELLDNFDISIYEKNYKECMRFHEILNEMKISKNFQAIIQKYEIRKILESHYALLSETIYSELTNEAKVDINEKNLINYLFQINQVDKAKNGYFELISKRNRSMIKKELGDGNLISFDTELFSKLANEILESNLNALKTFKDYYSEFFKKTEVSFPHFGVWVTNECQNFYQEIKPSIFIQQNIDDIMDCIKEVVLIFNDFESKGLSLSFLIQRLFAEDFEKKIEEMLINFSEKLMQLQDQDEWKLYPIFAISNLDFYENELQKSFLKDIEFGMDLSFSMEAKSTATTIKELPVNETFDYKNFLQESGLKCSRFMIYFWNVVFYLLDNFLKGVSSDSYPIFSSYSLVIIEKKLYEFIEDFIGNLEFTMTNSVKLGELQSLNRISNFYSLFYLINTISRSFEVRTASLKLTINKKWKELQKKIYGFIESTSVGYFKQKLLLNLPRIFNDEIKKVYCTKENSNYKPTNLFVRLAIIIENVNSNFQLILMKNLKDFLLNRLILYMFYIFEYQLYLEYHNNGKNLEFKFMIEKDLIKLLDIKLHEFGFYASRSAAKLGQITKAGMDYFIFDITFICFLTNFYIKDPKLYINSEEFLARILHVYCKEVKIVTPNDFIIKKEFFGEKIKKYLNEEFKAEKELMKQKMEKLKISNSMEQSNVIFL